MASLGEVFSLMEREKGRYRSTVHAAIAMEYHNLLDPHLWPSPVMQDADQEEKPTKEIVSLSPGGRSDLLSRCSRDISKSVQFPVSTAFLHGMGIIATAMTPFFQYKYYGSIKKCNLYIVTSQPTGAGKSAVNDYFSAPVEAEYQRVSKANSTVLRRCILTVESLEKDLEQAKNIDEIISLENSISAEREKMKNYPVYTYTWTDITPEALEKHAGLQSGLFNLVSDEATVINSLLGDMYSDRMKNNEVLLKGWDGDLVSTARVGRGGYYGCPNGNVVVCAQDETLRAILHAGERGNGICQRFLLHREPTMMGKREFSDGSYTPTDPTIIAEYHNLIHNMMMETTGVTLDFSADAMKVIYQVKSMYEGTIADNGSNSQEMIRGVVAKVDKQIMKIACVLHAMQEWSPGGFKSKVISEETTTWAYSIYDALFDSFINSAASQGFLGKTTEIIKIQDYISRQVEKKKSSFTMQQLKDAMKNVHPFRGHTNLVKRLRDEILPELEFSSWICVDKNRILINPRLR